MRAAWRLVDREVDEADILAWDDAIRLDYATVMLHQDRAERSLHSDPEPRTGVSTPTDDTGPADAPNETTANATEGDPE